MPEGRLELAVGTGGEATDVDGSATVGIPVGEVGAEIGRRREFGDPARISPRRHGALRPDTATAGYVVAGVEADARGFVGMVGCGVVGDTQAVVAFVIEKKIRRA